MFGFKHRDISLKTFYYFPFPSLITPTQQAPIIKNTPAKTSIFTSGGMLPSVVNIFKTSPPNDAAAQRTCTRTSIGNKRTRQQRTKDWRPV